MKYQLKWEAIGTQPLVLVPGARWPDATWQSCGTTCMVVKGEEVCVRWSRVVGRRFKRGLDIPRRGLLPTSLINPAILLCTYLWSSGCVDRKQAQQQDCSVEVYKVSVELNLVRAVVFLFGTWYYRGFTPYADKGHQECSITLTSSVVM